MLLKDMLKGWLKFDENEIVIIDRLYGKSYYDDISDEVMNRKVTSFYFIDNVLFIRI